MADILVRFNQAETDVQSWANLKARHLGFSEESLGFWFKQDDGTDYGDPVLVPSTIGQGMGRRVAQTAHGFATKTLIRHNGSAWVKALATTDTTTLATHMVVRVLDANRFELSALGAWALGGTPVGPYYLSETTAGALSSTEPVVGISQRVAVGDGTSLHLTLSGNGGGATLPVDFQDFRAPVLAIVKEPPVSPVTGGRYLVYRTPTVGSEFEGYGNYIATYNGATWSYEAPVVGWVVTNKSNGVPYYYTISGNWKPMFSSFGFTGLDDPTSYVNGELLIWDGENAYSYDPVEPKGQSVPAGKTYGNAPETIADLKGYYGVSGRAAQNDGWKIFGFNPAGVDGAGGHGIMTFLATDDGSGTFSQGFLFVSGNGPGYWKELFYMEDGWGYQLFQLPSVSILGTDSTGKLVDKSLTELPLVGGALVNHLRFDTTPGTLPTDVGTFYWDATEHTTSLILENGSVLQVGLEELLWVQNNDTVPLTDGMLVYVSGAAGDNPRVKRATNADSTAYDMIAMVTQPIAVGAEGFVARGGRVRSLDTSAAAEGAKVYLGVDGAYTFTAPTSPAIQIQVGWVLRSHAVNGVIFFSPRPASIAAVNVQVGGVAVGAGKTLNFIPGTNVTISAVDQGDVVDVTVSASGGGGSGVDKYATTMDLAACSANVGVLSGSVTQWVAHATIFVPRADMTLVANTSKIALVCPQPVNGASYILAIYKWPSSGSACTLVAATSVNVMPGSSSWLDAVITTVAESTLVGGERYFAVLLWNGNGAQAAGVTGANLNVQPYIAFMKANLGVLTAAPATLTPESESNVHLFMRIKA